MVQPGSQPVRLTRLEAAAIGTPRWSQDDGRLVVTAHLAGRTGLFVLDAATGALRKIPPMDAAVTAPNWATNGQSLYSGSDRDGSWQIWKHPLEEGDPVRLT